MVFIFYLHTFNRVSFVFSYYIKCIVTTNYDALKAFSSCILFHFSFKNLTIGVSSSFTNISALKILSNFVRYVTTFDIYVEVMRPHDHLTEDTINTLIQSQGYT